MSNTDYDRKFGASPVYFDVRRQWQYLGGQFVIVVAAAMLMPPSFLSTPKPPHRVSLILCVLFSAASVAASLCLARSFNGSV